MGYGNKFGWLATANVTFLQKATETPNEIPAALWRLDFTSLFAR